MLRSGVKIKVNAKTMQNYDGMLIAPEIDIFGLVLKADSQQPLDPRVIDFFTSRGAKIGRVKIFGDFFIRIAGEFNITKQEIHDFLRSNTDINIASLANLRSGMPSNAMKRHLEQLAAKVYDTNRTVIFTDGFKVKSYTQSLMHGKISANLTSGGDILQSSIIMANTDANFNSGKDIHFKGQPIDFETHNKVKATINGIQQEVSLASGMSDVSSINVGWFGLTFAGNNLNLHAKRCMVVEDHIVDAVNIISLDAGVNGNVRIEIDRSREWMNNPYPEFFVQYIKHSPGTIRLMTESEYDEASRYNYIVDLIKTLNLSEFIDSIQCPKELQCPISLCLMRDPVILGDTGKTYDRAAIRQALKKSPYIDPLTNGRLEYRDLLINYSIRNMVEDFIRNDATGLVDKYIEERKKTNSKLSLNKA